MENPPSEMLVPPELVNTSARMQAAYLRRCAAYWQSAGFDAYAEHLRKQADDLDEKDGEGITAKDFANAIKDLRPLPKKSLDDKVAEVASAVEESVRVASVKRFARQLRGQESPPAGPSPEVRQRLAEADRQIARELEIGRLRKEIKRIAAKSAPTKTKRKPDKYDLAIEEIRLAKMERRGFLIECQCSDGLEADEGEPVLRGVRVLGEDSRNRRRYTQQAMQDALPLYEGAKVYLDHPDHPTDTRKVDTLFGRLFNPRIENGGIVADLHYNPAHPKAKAILWFARNDPSALGLSHNAMGQGETRDGVFEVHKIHSVRSVDLVAEPATTSGLFVA